jgi:hypothetical protein
MMDIDPVPITAWLALFLAISGVIATVASLFAWAARKRDRAAKLQREEMIDLIKETTKPIQPTTNGGWSLSDLHDKVDRIERKYESAHEADAAARDLWHERYFDDQRRTRKEWTAVFIAIRKMIHLPPDAQLKMWDGITQSYIDGTIADKYPDERQTDEQVP